MDYSLVKSLLFRMDAEKSHFLALNFLRLLHTLGLNRYFSQPASSPREFMGLTFPNAVGLAAGFDKNGDYIDALATLGFGFIEVGTVTPQPQVGSVMPRLFRLPEQAALIHRMGFNNKGVDYLVSRLRQMKYIGILGVNISRGQATSVDRAVEDYLYCFRRVAPVASYVAMNIAAVNGDGVRELQASEVLRPLLQALKTEQALFLKTQQRYVPLVVKMAPDWNELELQEIVTVLREEKIDGVIATDATESRVDLVSNGRESSRLSGAPLSARSTEVIRQLSKLLGAEIPIIASGGVMGVQDAQRKLEAGAHLLQIYSGLIYHGPGLVGQLCELKTQDILLNALSKITQYVE